jgi:hypothetical protein
MKKCPMCGGSFQMIVSQVSPTEKNVQDAVAQRIGKMENARSHLEIFRDISAENVLSGFHILLIIPNFLFFLCSSLEVFS